MLQTHYLSNQLEKVLKIINKTKKKEKNYNLNIKAKMIHWFQFYSMPTNMP